MHVSSTRALQGALLIVVIPRAMPWARSFWAFSPYLNHMRKFCYLFCLAQVSFKPTVLLNTGFSAVLSRSAMK